MSAIVLPNGTAWALMSSPTRLFKGTLTMAASSITGSGTLYTLGTTTVPSTVSLTGGSLPTTTTFSGNIASEAYSLTYQTRYATAATLAGFAGTWTGNLAAGTVSLTWTLSSLGALTGTSSTGCTYSGTGTESVSLRLRPEAKAVVDAVVTETCSGVVKQLSGVAVLSGTTGLVMLLTTSTGTDEALAVILSK
jgi:hypothetical protein